MANTRLDWAKWMSDKGIIVFICDENSKRPLFGNSWYIRQTLDHDQIDEWFDITPNCNYGLHLGQSFCVVDLDFDPDTGKNGIWEFEAICAEHGIEDFFEEIPTLTVRTPSGGYHLYFKVPFPVANKNDFPNGIDCRGAVGYVVGPGSEIDGKQYEVLNPDTEILDAPSWLVDNYLQEPHQKNPNHDVPLIEWDLPESVAQAERWVAQHEPAIEGQSGDEYTYETCCKLRDFGLSEDMALRVLTQGGWNQKCEPPWDVAELEVKISNSYEYGQNRPGCESEVYKVRRLASARPAGGYAALTQDQLDALYRPKSPLERAAEGETVSAPVEDDDDGIPQDVADDDDHLIEESDEQLWFDMNDFLEIDKVREYIVSEWFLAHGITSLLATRGTGKSTIALDLAFHLACDMEWWNLPTMKGWKVIYICGEDDEGMILNARAWTQYHERVPSRDRFLVARDIVKLTDEIILGRHLKEMIDWAQGERCVVLLDTWQRATTGLKSNAQEEMELAIDRAEYVAKQLNGPMLVCSHPPKDGSMTIRGSAVQEDTTSGIWHLHKETDGIKLVNHRAKGAGEENWRKFRLEKIEVGGVDTLGKPLEGIIPIKVAGTEDEGSSEYIETVRSIDKAWGKAVRGCIDFPTAHPSVERIDPKRSQVADMIYDMWDKSKTGDSEAQEFVEEYMDELLLNGVTDLKTAKIIYTELDDRFFKKEGMKPIRFEDGLELYLRGDAPEPKPDGKKTRDSRKFDLRKEKRLD